MIHICIATMGNQENIDRLLSWDFWHDARHQVENVYILSQLKPIRLAPKTGLILEYSPNALGCGGARQHMVDYFIGKGLKTDDILVFLDDDIEILETGWLEKLIKPLSEGFQLSGVEGRKLTKKMPRLERKTFDYLSGGWLACAGEVFIYACQFDEQFFPNYWEDADLSFQAKQRGFKLACVGDIGLRHDERLKAGAAELLEQNRTKFYAKWGLE